MPDTSTADRWRLSQLNADIERLDAKASELDADRGRLVREAARARRRLRYLRAARATRAPAESFELWRVGLLTVGPIAAGILLLIAASVFLPASMSGLLVFLIGAACGLALLALLSFRPTDEALPGELQAAAAEVDRLRTADQESAAELAAVRSERQRLADERRELMASGQVQRAALLQRDWKAMAPAEWEDLVVEALRTLGATVERHPPEGKLPPVLLVRLAGRTTAALTRGAGKVVDSSAVNQALEARQRHQAAAAAVVINRRFTGAAQDLARHRDCRLFGVEEFPDLVLGKLEL